MEKVEVDMLRLGELWLMGRSGRRREGRIWVRDRARAERKGSQKVTGEGREEEERGLKVVEKRVGRYMGYELIRLRVELGGREVVHEG